MHIHLDAVDGVAGDMFVAALLDAWPELAETAIDTVQLFMQNQELSLGVERANDGNLTGSRFCVSMPSCEHKHDHTHWRNTRSRIESSLLSNGIKQHALGIFSELVKTESSVHGTKIDDVSLHEVGN